MGASEEASITMPLGPFSPGLDVPAPAEGCGPIGYAEALGEAYLSFSRHHHRKNGGHYLTPAAIARFMAGHSTYSEVHMRVLDPGSGTGILSAAACEAASRSGTVKSLHVDAYEIAADKLLHLEGEKLALLGVPITEHDKLPDVVLYDEERNWLYLAEAVTSHGPVTPQRFAELEATLGDCTAVRVYVSAFPNFRQFKRHADDIAWETEVWLAEIPDHLIHFNGDRFLGPRER